MIKLYQLETCPWCHEVRNALSRLGLDYESINVPKLHSQRSEVFALGVETSEVPTLVDGDTVLQDSDAILAYLDETYGGDFGEPRYGLTRVLEGISFADAVPQVKDALMASGFGVLSEIDVSTTMKNKLDVEMQPYVILGACNPPLAHEALSAEPGLGLLLPCNVVVTQNPDGNAVVSAVDPILMFTVVKRDEITQVAKKVRGMLAKALDAIGEK